jgi:membrane protease YdiL (CAAX protease family)
MPERDPIRPILGAALCMFLYYVTLVMVTPAMNFLGGRLAAITVTTLLAGCFWSALGMAIFESRSLADLGLRWHCGAGRNLLTGVAVGAGGALLAIIPPVMAGLAHFERMPGDDVSLRGALFTPLLLLCGAAGEEIAFRGFALQFLMRGYGAWAGILGMGALFGLLHANNPGATTLGIVNTAGFGVLFGAALLRTHDLWLPIGIHFGWNAALPFLGVDLSGLTIKVTDYELVWKAGNLWSGGSYGPEASLLASAVLVILFAAVWKIPVCRVRAYLLDSPEYEAGEPRPAP